MNSNIKDFCKKLDQGVDSVRDLSKKFRQTFDLTGFAYVRVYLDGRVGWVSSDADHDRLLIESGFLKEDPLIDTPKLLKEGRYLWFHDRQFPGCEAFYRDRSQLFGLDHGLVVVNHHKDYLETGCFSGCLAKRPLYNLFLKETGLFLAFLEYFKNHLNKPLSSLLEEGLTIDDLKTPIRKPISNTIPSEDRCSLVSTCGWASLLKLSPREKQCLALVWHSYTYQEIGESLNLSPRTIEHYLESIKNKLGIDTRAELRIAAKKLIELGLADETIFFY